MPKKESTIHLLLRLIKAPKSQKQMSISKPNTLDDVETKVLEEVNQKLSIIEELSQKNYDQQHLLALMKTIKKFSEKEKTFENINILREMIAMYEEKVQEIGQDWFQRIPLATVPFTQDIPKISLFQQQLQLQATKLKPVNRIDIQENASSTQQESNQTVLVLKHDNITRNKLKPVQNAVIATEKQEFSELDKLLAKRKIISEGTNSIDTVISIENFSDEVESILFAERRVKALSTILEEVELERNSLFFILPKEIRANEMSDRYANAESQELLEFIEAEKQMALEEKLQQELTEAEEKLEQLFQGLIVSNNQNVKSSEITACTSAYFENSRPLEYRPDIVKETIKPTP